MTGNLLDLTTEGMVHGGQTLARHANRVIFTPYTVPGERIRARLTDDRGRFAFAECVEVVTPSPHRVTPRCPHFGPGKCGGCHFQHIDYAVQPGYKRDVVIDQLKRIGGFRTPPVSPAVASPDAWGYRHHATFHVDAAGRLCFVGTDNSTLIPIDECHIIRPELRDLLAELNLEDVPELDRVRVQVGSEGDTMLVLSTRDDQPPGLEVTIPVSVNFLLSDNEPVNLIGSTTVSYTVRGRAFRVTAGGFFQVNPPVAELLVDMVLDRLALRGDETVLDLYAGVGLFTAFLAERSSLVISVESYPPAVSDADVNLADLDNIDLVEGAVEDVIDALDGPIDAVVLDPPRSGVDGRALDALIALRPRTIVYVSCEPSTLARDAKRLAARGYRLLDVTPVDMFPQTFHVESVAHFALASAR